MTTTRRARRTVRSAALVAVAAAAALSLTACQSGGSGGSKDGAARPEQQVSASAAPSGTTATGTGTGTGKTTADVRTETLAPSRTATPATPATPAAPAARTASPVRTRTLADGSTAEIYRLGAEHYRAKIVSRGAVLATIETGRSDAGLDANDMFVVLTLGGDIHSWTGGGHTGPGTFKLAGGWTAKVTKVGELRYRAQILGNDGSVDATLEANQHDVGLDANGVYIVLSAGGVISAHE
ncbi:hypothetical protein AB0D74_10530 [Streptomyces sp. NPDC048278]|uniref:hypothetical protein n=1 Tax=Streptomyces sp. NPDC048278 TaxID=3155809 RepID=UPI00343088CF